MRLVKLKVRSKLLISYIVLISLPLIILGVFAYHNASSALFNQASQQIISVADKSVEQIDSFLGLCRSNIQDLAQMPNQQ